MAHYGVNLSNANLSNAKLLMADLASAELNGVNLNGANLKMAHLGSAKLIGANLYGANLSGAMLNNAKFIDANLSLANLGGAKLIGANLSGAWLKETKLTGADLRMADLSRAKLSGTVLDDLDIGSLARADVDHQGPSTVNWRSIAMSLKAPNLHQFLVDTGMPEVIATYMIDCCTSIDPEEMFTMMQSTFISYGSPDEAFARKIRDALKDNGVQTWFFPSDAEPGQKLHRVMSRGVENHDRVIVICSESSLGRAGLAYEMEQALDKEAELGGEELIIPVILDGYLFDGWEPKNPEHGKALRSRVAADFRDEGEFGDSLGRLLKALEKRRPPISA